MVRPPVELAASARHSFILGVRALSVILIGTIISLPFGLMLVTTTLAAQSVLVVTTIILGALALQANTHQAALRHIELHSGPHPTQVLRDRLVFDASLLTISSIVVSMSALSAIQLSLLPVWPWTGVMTWTQAFILSAIGAGIVVVNNRPLIYSLIALTPIVLPVLASLQQLDLLTVALWQCLTSITLIVTTIEFQLRSFVSHHSRNSTDILTDSHDKHST